MKKIYELYRYRYLIANLTVNELKLRYRRSTLGFLWSFLNPLLMMLVLTAVFSTLMRFQIKDYAVFLFAGLLPWTFFSQSVMLSLMSIVGKSSLLRKVYIPKSVLPLSAVLSTLVNFILSLAPLLLLTFLITDHLSIAIAFLPVSIALFALFTCGVSFIFSTLNVFFRDFQHMTDVLLQVFFYASPIIYEPSMLPEKFRPFFAWNPLVYLIDCFRAPIYEGVLPSMHSLTIATASALTAFFIGFIFLLSNEQRFVLNV